MRNNIKISIVAVALSGILALTGCGGGAKQDAKPAAPKATFPTKAVTMIDRDMELPQILILFFGQRMLHWETVLYCSNDPSVGES